MPIQRAIVRYGIGADHANEGRQIEIAEPRLLQELIHFFKPGLGGKRSNRAGGWVPYYIVDFVQDDGLARTVLVKPDFRAYAVRGDWPLDPEFRQFVDEYLAPMFDED